MTERSLVADSSPLIALARIDRLDLLKRLSKRVLMPPGVRDEVIVRSPQAPGAREISLASWIEVSAPDPALVGPLAILVGRGEAEAIALAQGLAAEGAWVLVDDARARRLAKRLQIQHIGTVGILRRAKKAGLIPQVAPLLGALEDAGIYIQKSLAAAVLKDLGEI